MDVTEYFRSISGEFDVLKNRVRNFIDTAHWQTDGEWKESILRTVLRRHFPANTEVARGFVVSNRNQSTQIDVMFYDQTKPVLYRDGDLVFITPDAVQGIIEVKTTVTGSNLSPALGKLTQNAQFIRRTSRDLRSTPYDPTKLFVGLFAYDVSPQLHKRVLDDLKVASQGDADYVVNNLSLGKSHFVHFWEQNPDAEGISNYNCWHLYQMDNLSRGYFVNNAVDAVSGSSVQRNSRVWFPRFGENAGTKEIHNPTKKCL